MTSHLFAGLLGAVEHGSFPRARKWAWRALYEVLSRAWSDPDWRFMNYGFVPKGAPFALRPEDEPDRPFIGLYQQAVTSLPLAGARVLEIGSGRGGGSRYLARYCGPAKVVGLDYSAATVQRARRLNAGLPTLFFEVGDAERLPFANGSFDIVVNIESSHCYADVPSFAREVARVLAPGGWFSFADMRAASAVAKLDRDLAVSGLRLVESRDLAPGVVAALDSAEARKSARLDRIWLVRRFMREFSGTQGSILYKALAGGEVAYVARRFWKSNAETNADRA